MKPLAIDLFCGLGGWAEGLLATGWRVVGFDVHRHVYGTHRYPAELVLQDVRTIHGSQFRGASLIVASPPCQEFSYMAMPFSRGKRIAAALRGQGEFPVGYTGSRTIAELRALFDACFRIQREACEAAGRHIPMIVENVRGAQPWVGKAARNYGSYYLWGDVPALMPSTRPCSKVPGLANGCFPGGGLAQGRLDIDAAQKRPGRNFHGPERGESSPSFNGAAHETRGVKHRESASKLAIADCVGRDDEPIYAGTFGWNQSVLRRANSHSHARRAASALIAKIPGPLAEHIGKVFFPAHREEAVSDRR